MWRRPGASNGGKLALDCCVIGTYASIQKESVDTYVSYWDAYGIMCPLKDTEARKQYQKEYRLQHLAEYTERDRKYREENPDKIYERNKKYVEANREKQREWSRKAGKKWRDKNGAAYQRQYAKKEGEAEKHVARVTLYKAVKAGKLIRPDHCVLCGIKCKPHGHHPDYDKPLEVIWLCAPCHKQADYRRSLLTR